jgi:error-prone DNA polymerase
MSKYIELHTCSAFSFLEGSSTPEKLAQEAARLGYPSLALLDRGGVYGAPRFYRACKEVGVRPIVGAEIPLEEGCLPLLVRSREGYQNLCRLITDSKLDAEKGEGQTILEEFEPYSSGLVCLTGGDKGPLPILMKRGSLHALNFLKRLKKIWGDENVYVEIQRHFDREQESRNQILVDLADQLNLPLLATRYARSSGRLLHDVLTCIKHRTNLDEAGKLLNRNAECHLKSPGEMTQIFADLPQALTNSVELSHRLDFTLKDLGYQFPAYDVPSGETMDRYLRKLTEAGARDRYRPFHEKARRQIEYELNIIQKLGLAGYFLIVWDIVQFCRRHEILVQGRGSAANSAVCYSLGITAVDPVGMELLFERFLSEERGEWPDIDLDLPSGDRRESVIQYVYEHYGRRGAAMTANVITYRCRSAAREVGKALAVPLPVLDRLSKLLVTWGWSVFEEEGLLLERFQEAGLNLSHRRVENFVRLWREIQDLPRHLGQHTGGMIICQGRLDSVVPVERARMPERTVVQWDKDDCADLGISKVDLLGLGMMSAIHESLELIGKSNRELDLAHLPQNDPKVYSMLQQADTVGVFQVESRAQMATLPRLKPTCFYDLVVEVAIIRPGPIVGKMVHPYLRRRAGLEPVTYPHPSLEPILKRTLGVPLFQEQLLRIAMVAAGFTGGEAEELRRALGFKKPDGAMVKIEKKLRGGLEKNGIRGETAETIIRHITSFALYGFPESHAASFALLAYASAYLKAHFPAEFYTALLNNQPMGFYHPATLVKDAQHRGQRVKPVDVQKSDWRCRVEEDQSIRLGLVYVKGLREETGQCIEMERRRQLFSSVDDLQRRVRPNRSEITTLARIGALNSFGLKRREALWQVEKACRFSGPLFEKASSPYDTSPLQEMTAMERLASDYEGAGITIGPHAMALKRKELDSVGIVPSVSLKRIRDGQRVRVAGTVIVRQRPMTAKGFLFMSLEDETGISNIVFRPKMFKKNRLVLMSHPFLIIEGMLQNQNNVISVLAHKVRGLKGLDIPISSHDFH